MGFFGFGENDVHKALGQTAPGVTWQVVRDTSDDRVWHAAFRKAARTNFPALSTEQAQLLAPDVWGNLRRLRAQVKRIEIWVETDSGEWVVASDNGVRVVDTSPPQFA